MTRSIAIWLASIVISTLAALASPAFAQPQPTGRNVTNSIGMEFVPIRCIMGST